MHPPTVIAILALHLLCSGLVTLLIGRRLDSDRGLLQWGSGSVLFGCAYAGRLIADPSALGVLPMLLDCAMIGAALLFLVGLSRFADSWVPNWSWLVTGVAGYAGLDFVVMATHGPVGRHVLLNSALAAIYVLIAGVSLRQSRSRRRGDRAPHLVLFLLMAGLALLTLGRAYALARDGEVAIFGGLYAQIFYAYASVAAVLLALILIWMVFVELADRLAKLASRDALTQALNRNGLNDVLQRHFVRRNPPPLAVLQLDIDHFKRVNDTWGHATGDRALCAVAERLAASVRAEDFVARIGGEEFLIVCGGADALKGSELAERLRSAVESLRIAAPDGSSIQLTASLGVSTPFTTLDAWPFAAMEADKALYAAKASGRNRVISTAPMGLQPIAGH